MRLFILLVIINCFYGCQTVAPAKSRTETKEDIQAAVGSVAGAVSGKPLTKEELDNLKKQIREEPEAQSAVQSITDALSGKSMAVKYCPVTGKRYAADLDICPVHRIELKTVER